MPTRWLFGAGALNELGRQPLPGRTALLVSSSGRSAKDSGSLYRVMELLAHGGAEFRLFDQVESNPSKDTVMAGARFARRNGCDFVVALGGGSVMDAAKAIAAMSTNEGDLWDYVSDAPAADDGLVDYTVEGVGTFRLPEGFEMETGSTTEPLPTNYVVFEKDGVTISCSRFGKNAYEAAGVPLPADVEEYSTRSGVQNAVPAGTEFAYDSYGSYAAQFTDEDGISWYYVLLKGTDAYASCYLYAPADAFDADSAALWISGTVIE